MSGATDFKKMLTESAAAKLNMSLSEVEQAFEEMNSKLVGNWKSDDNTRFKFEPNDTFEISDGQKSVKGQYQAIAENLFMYTDSSEMLTSEIQIAGNKLTVIDDGSSNAKVFYRI